MLPTSSDTEINGFEMNGYDSKALHPTNICWIRQSRFPIPKKPQFLWKTQIKKEMLSHEPGSSGFCIDRDGNAIIASGEYFGHGAVYSIDPCGKSEKIFHYDNCLRSPVIMKDGSILVSTCETFNATRQKLLCISPKGILQWEFTAKYLIYGQPAIAKDGSIFFYATKVDKTADEDLEYALFCVSQTGKLKWMKKFLMHSWHEPLISIDGSMFLGFDNNQTIYSFDLNCNEKWSKVIGHGLSDSPFIIKSDGTMYISLTPSPNSYGRLLAMSPTGNVIWNFCPGNANISTAPSLDWDENLYFATTRSTIISISSSGIKRWETKIPGATSVSPIIGSNGIVLQESLTQSNEKYTSFLSAYDSKSGERLWELAVQGILHSALPASNGMIYLLFDVSGRDRIPVLELRAIGETGSHAVL